MMESQTSAPTSRMNPTEISTRTLQSQEVLRFRLLRPDFGHAFAVRHLPVEHFPYGSIQLIDGGLLREQNRAAGVENGTAGFLAGLDGQSDDDGLGPSGLDARRGFDAVLLGHVEVHHDQGGTQLLDQFDRLIAVRALADDHHILVRFQKAPEPLADHRMVINEQESNGIARWRMNRRMRNLKDRWLGWRCPMG